MRSATGDGERLLARQERLQAEARAVIAELDLLSLLGRLGRVEVIGSAASGLMVWRDLDVMVLGGPDFSPSPTVPCPEFSSAAACAASDVHSA